MQHVTQGSEALASYAGSLVSAVQSSSVVRTRPEMARWLQESIQQFIPHEFLFVAWGSFRTGSICYDFVPSRDHEGPSPLTACEVRDLVNVTFAQWQAAGQVPNVTDLSALGYPLDGVRRSMAGVQVALAHGLVDQRSHYDCLYVFVGSSVLATARAHQLARLLVPSIDAGFRQATPLHSQPVVDTMPEARPGESINVRGSEEAKLSPREREIMQWVRIGKTNTEVALIMNLSVFTVKNHMRRIYQKLDVLNRAQAVGRLRFPTDN